MLISKCIAKKIVNVGLSNKFDRDSWIEKTLKKIPSGSVILDAGAGEQQYRKFCNHLKYLSQDFAKYDGKGDGFGLQTSEWDQSKLDIVSDIINMPLNNDYADAIMCTEVFEHLPEPILAIKEFSRILKKNGYLILTTPFCSLTHYSPYHYYSGFNVYFFMKFLKEYRFEILDIKANGNYFEYIAQEIMRLNSISKKYTNSKVRFYEWFAISAILNMIKRFSKNDKGSSELLNYGYFIFAKKNN